MEHEPITTDFDEALARWEAGDLSRDELGRRFPDEDVAGLLVMYEELQIAAAGPTPDPAEAWTAVRERLPVGGDRPVAAGVEADGSSSLGEEVPQG